MNDFDLSAVQSALREFDFSGWLFYDFRGSDPLARNVLGLSQRPAGTRRWFYYVGAEGEPRGLVHHIESGALDGRVFRRTARRPTNAEPIVRHSEDLPARVRPTVGTPPVRRRW